MASGVIKNTVVKPDIYNAPASLAVSNNVETVLAQQELSKGTWLILCGCGWWQNNTGYRQIFTGDGRNKKDFVNATTGAMTQQSFCYVDTFGNTTNITLKGLQNSGSALQAYPYIGAIKLF